MTYPLVQFVDSPDVTAESRFDLNDGTTWPEHDAYSLGAPSIEGDPDGIGVAYGFRTLSFNLRVEDGKVEALRVMSALARELLRETNWLLFQLSAFSEPVWFRTYRTSPGNVSFDQVFSTADKDSWQVSVTLMADSFAVGALRTLGPFVVPCDPAGSDGAVFDVTGIIGDAPAPAMILDSSSGGVTGVRTYGVLAVRQHGTPSDHTFVRQGEVCAFGQDTASVVDAVHSNAGAARVSFTTTTAMALRVTWVFSTTHVTVEQKKALAGRFRVFAKVRRSDATSVIKVRAGVGVYADALTLPLTTSNIIVDLGLVTTQDLAAPGYSAPAPVDTFANLVIDAQRVSGAGTLDIDFIMMLPADEQFITWTQGFLDTVTMDLLIDGVNERMVKVFASNPFSGSTEMRTRDPISVTGGFPDLMPGQTNRFYAITGVYAASPPRAQWGKTTDTFYVSYYPRWLWLGSD